tara:strand:+ start:821 stop:1201 length:381 start_codon:yes stop_codon:yes gene_type:complete
MVMKKILIIILFTLLSTNSYGVEKKTNFTKEIFNKAKSEGKTIVINSYEEWCYTCTKQVKVLNEAEAKFTDIVFLSYEQSKHEDIGKLLNIEFWTTIVVYKGDEEKSRLIGVAKKKDIFNAILKGI